MPCYDSRERVRVRYESGISPQDLAKVKKENEWLVGALCAVFNELERRGVAADVLAEASRNGLIGVLEFWAEHKSDDVSRLARELHKYSKDEQQVLRELLNT
jgi:hypothetical protein